MLIHTKYLLSRVFVTQTAVCTTKTLAPKGVFNHSKVVIKETEKIDAYE